MKKTKINVFTNFNNREENNDILAIKDNYLIKYIDLDNNKMVVDMENNVITRENRDYLYKLEFNNNIITVLVKKLNKEFEKKIKTLEISKSLKDYLVRYLLIDEDIINEYYVKFWNNYCIMFDKMI